jgi:2-keto-4-pentenoate hydratase/2-oxohepta-3-ene-1,7-dioic acid hydratase in catechol pathway
MDKTRRDFLALGATTALAAVATGVEAAEPVASPSNASLVVPADGRLRLVSYVGGRGQSASIGVVKANGRIVNVTGLVGGAKSMVALIEAGPAALAEVRKLAAAGSDDGPLVTAVKLLAPIPDIRRNIYAVGWNYLAHFEESKELRKPGEELPEHPVFFTKAVHSLNGPFDSIPYDPTVSTMIDWECELAVIIGKRGRNITEANALDHVFGYTVLNDTTARDLQSKKHGGQWFKGKSLDGHGPMGPWIVPANEIDHANVHLLLRVNGVVKQDATTKQMYFKVPRIIAELSQGLTLEPGDIITTGTPPGVGYARKPPEFLKPGDIMESEIVEIGTIRNTFVAV